MTKRPAIDFAEAKPFDIFRTGRHTPMVGAAIDFGESDLARIADAYDPALSQAPIVVGHPAIDSPAYGWISGLDVDGDRLRAVPEQVDPAFADLVRAGRFKRVSASFYRPGQANNPKPDGYYLRHVGFLGATPPAVKGLRAVEFGDDDGCLTIDFGDWATASATRVTARLFRALRDWMIGTAGQDAADRVLPDWDVQTLSDLPTEIDPSPAVSSIGFATTTEEDPDMPTAAELEARQTALNERESALKEREADAARRVADFAEKEIARKAGEDAALLDALVGAGRVPKEVRPIVDALFGEVRSLETTVDFADGDTTAQLSPRDLLGRLLKALPTPVVTGEMAKDVPVDFADADAVRTAIDKEIAAAADRGVTITASMAAARIKGR